jgi:hypothetical protein
MTLRKRPNPDVLLPGRRAERMPTPLRIERRRSLLPASEPITLRFALAKLTPPTRFYYESFAFALYIPKVCVDRQPPTIIEATMLPLSGLKNFDQPTSTPIRKSARKGRPQEQLTAMGRTQQFESNHTVQGQSV